MAQTPGINVVIDGLLHYGWGMTEDLVEFIKTWEQVPDWERASWNLDWDLFVQSFLPRLDHDYQSGRMSPEQVTSYHTLLSRLGEQRPATERLRLTVPALPSDT